jgi:hypothetical protein
MAKKSFTAWQHAVAKTQEEKHAPRFIGSIYEKV